MKNFALESFKNPDLPLYNQDDLKDKKSKTPKDKKIKDFQLRGTLKFSYSEFHKDRCYLGSLFGEKNYKREEYITTSRMIVGKGDASVFETSIALHSLYGYPYIPAEAVDGVVRRYMIEQYFGNEEKEAQKCPFFCHLFGSTNNSKALHIFDVFPVDVTVEYNIMTPHYGDYYSNQKAPSDAGKISPLKYPVVAEESKFQFSYAIKGEKRFYQTDMNCADCPHIVDGKCKFNGQDCLQFAAELLENTLIENGIGGKTTSGLGRLKKYDTKEGIERLKKIERLCEIERLKELKSEFDTYRPTKKSIDEIFGEGNWFVIDQPFMHYAGGDFYFIEKKDEIIYIILGDCTGHGLEGAENQYKMLPTIKTIIEKKYTEPGKFITDFLTTSTLSNSANLFVIIIHKGQLLFTSHSDAKSLYLFKPGNPPLEYTNKNTQHTFPEKVQHIDKLVLITDWTDKIGNRAQEHGVTKNHNFSELLKDNYTDNIQILKTKIVDFIKPLRITKRINGVEIIDDKPDIIELPIINDDITVLGLDFTSFK